MSDPSAGALPGAPPQNVGNALSAALTSAPELGNSPGVAVGVAASGGDTVARAQAVAHSTNTISDSNAQDRVGGVVGGVDEVSHALSWFSGHVGSLGSEAVTGLKKAGSAVLNTMNMPLNTVNHMYRYLHDVEATHGPGAALMEGLGLAVGAGLGFAATGSVYGAEMGAEGAGYLEGRLTYRDSWQRTANPSYVDPHTHQYVSPGNDVVQLLGLNPKTTINHVTADVIDGLFNLQVGGPELGGLVNEARSAEGIKGTAAPIIGDLLRSRWGGTAPRTIGDAVNGVGVIEPSEMDRIYNQYSGIRRAFDDIASKSAQQIISTPYLRPFIPIAEQLGAARTGEEVAQVFKGVLRTQELVFTDRLPSLSWTRLHLGQNLREWAEAQAPTTVDHVGVHPYQRFKAVVNPANVAQRVSALPVAFDDARKAYSLEAFDPSSKIDDGTRGIYHQVRFTEDGPTAASIAWHYHNLPSVGQKVLAYRNITLNTLFSMAGLKGYANADFLKAPDVNRYLKDAFTDPQDRREMAKAIDNAIGGGMFGKEAWYGVDEKARNLSLVRSLNGEASYGAAIWKNQTGKLAFLNLSSARRAAATLSGARDALGRLDDFAYHAITQGFFKPVVLLTPSYALHISLAELIPNALREGTWNLAKSVVAGHTAKLGYRIGEYEAGQAAAASILDKITDAQARGLSPNTIERLTKQYDALMTETEKKKISAIAGLAYDTVTSGMKKAPTRMTADLQRRLENQMVYLEGTEGHTVAPGVASSHDFQHEVNREEKSVSLTRRSYFESPMKTSRDFGLIGNGSDQFIPAWRAQIKEIADDETGQMAAQHLIDAGRRGLSLTDASDEVSHTLADYMRQHPDEFDWALRADPQVTAMPRGELRAPDRDQWNEFATAKVDALRGTVMGAGGQVNADVLRAIAEGQTPSRIDLEAIAEENRPVNVKGREMIPDSSGGIQKIANWGFRNVLNPMVNMLSRQPIAANEFDRQWELVKPLTRDHKLVPIEEQEPVFRYDNETPVPMEAERRAEGLYLTRENPWREWSARDAAEHYPSLVGTERPEPYSETGSVRTAFVLDKRGALHLADNPELTTGENAARHFLGEEEFDRLSNGSVEQVRDYIHRTWPSKNIATSRSDKLHLLEIIGGQKARDAGFKSIVLDGGLNHYGHEAVALSHDVLVPHQIMKQVPLMDYDEALNLAMARTTIRVMRNVHNLTDRTQWTETLRNWIPFYFAQEQAYRRMGRLLAENPRAFRQYQLMISNVGNMGQAFQGKDNRNYFVFPGQGWFDAPFEVLGALAEFKVPLINASPIGMGWNLSASSVIFPLSAGARPDIGPLLAVPTQALAMAVGSFLSPKLHQDMTTSMDFVLGPSANQSLLMNLVPNTIIQRWLEGRWTGFDQRSFNSVAMQTLQSLSFEGKIPDPAQMAANPALAQTFIDRWRNQTQIMYAAKAILGAVTPVSPEIQVQNWGLPTELSNDITKQGSLLKGISVFLAKHPDATPFTVWQSGSPDGVSVPASVAAENWINEQMGSIKKYGPAVLLLMPIGTDSTYNANVYNEQVAQGIRAKLAPFEDSGNGQFPSYLNQLYINAGNAVVLGQWYPQYQKQLAGLTGAEKYQAEQNWQQTLTNYAAMNPIWGQYWNEDQKSGTGYGQRGMLINQMKQFLASPDAPKTQVATETRTLLDLYDKHVQATNVATADGGIGQTVSQLNEQWKNDLYATAAAHPELANVINGLFLSLPQQGAATPSASAPGENPAAPGTFNARNWRAA